MPRCAKQLERFYGLATYNSYWVTNFAGLAASFLIPKPSKSFFSTQKLYKSTADTVLAVPDHNKLLRLETHVSAISIAATLSHERQPVPLFSHCLIAREIA